MAIIKNMICIIADIVYLFCGKELKNKVDMDVVRNLKWDINKDRIKGRIVSLNYLLITKDEFRSIFYFRMRRYRCLLAISRLVLPEPRSIEICGDIGGGFMVSHYHSVICPKKAGTNFRVGPGAVIDGFVTFGNNVYVASNSTVIGEISVGDNVIIGGGSVVTEDLLSDGVYVGNPARLIKKIGEDEKLLNEIM